MGEVLGFFWGRWGLCFRNKIYLAFIYQLKFQAAGLKKVY